MKKFFLLFGLLFLNCWSMQDLANQMRKIVNSYDDSQETVISKIEKLLEEGCDVNCNMDGDGFTVLHYAVLKKKYQVCEFLVKKGANPHIENCDDETPLSLADGAGHSLCASIFKNERLIEMLKLSECNVYRPGMNRRYAENAWKEYNKRYGLQLELGAAFKKEIRGNTKQ